ncbi:MAG: M48 family metalloprotease [Myxococcales bacterium]|nr:M48 family metalloprotease [Myxococcales bacterium]
MRLHLLQTTVRLSRESHPELYAQADAAAAALSLQVPVELFQGSDDGGLNAMLLYAPQSARVVLYGAMQEKLSGEEMCSVLGHELAHHKLWTADDGAYLHALRQLEGLASHTEAPSVLETLRLYTLHTEIFADRGGVLASDLDTTLRTLIRVRTGLSKVSVADFLAQSHELLQAQGTGSREWSHPEAHIRALALERHAADEGVDAERWVQRVVEGPLSLEALDLPSREALDAHTKALVAWLLQPPWFRTEAVMGHVRMLFDSEPLPEPAPLAPSDLDRYGDTVLDYLCAILVDFVAMDPELEDLPLQRADRVAEAMGLQKAFQTAVNRHLKRTRKAIAAALASRDSDLAAALEAHDAG